jgi:hypothetical protein
MVLTMTIYKHRSPVAEYVCIALLMAVATMAPLAVLAAALP